MRSFCSKNTNNHEKEDGKSENNESNSDHNAPIIQDEDPSFLDLKSDKTLPERVSKINLPTAQAEEVDEDAELEKTERGRIVRERRVFMQEFDEYMHEQKWGAFYGVTGIALFIVGSWTLMVPLYKLVCEKYGYTIKSQHQDYQEMQDKNDVFRKWRVHFKGQIEDDLDWLFEPETKVVQVNAGETALAFYKVYNNSDKPIVGLSVYQVDPNEASLYFNKVQCFCFENQLLQPKEYVDLPVFFYLDPLINRDPGLAQQVDLTVTYHFFPCADQLIAEVVQRELEKHEKEQEQLKINREKYGVTKEEREGRQDETVALPAFNPRRRSERALRQIREMQKQQEEDEEEDEEDDEGDEGDSSVLDQSIWLGEEGTSAAKAVAH